MPVDQNQIQETLPLNIQDAIRHGDMKRPQFLVVLVCIVLTMIDGFEVLMMAFVAPHLARIWRLNMVEVGYLLSSGIFGMALGAILISPLADRIGRRNHIVFCLAMIVLAMCLSGLSFDFTSLALSRVFAGLFIGGIMPSVNIIVSEYCSDRRRGTAMGLYGIGLPLGAALGGAFTNPLISAYGWQGPFFFAALLTAAILGVVLIYLPESIDYLIERKRPDALAKLNAIALRFGLPPMASLPPKREAHSKSGTLHLLIGGVMRRRTILLMLGFSLLSASFFFANTWTAKLMADSSGDPALGTNVGVLMVVGGLIGALLFAALSLRFRPRLITTVFAICGAASYAIFASQIEHTSAALALAVVIGIFANGSVTAFYVISPSVYQTSVRATGVGWMIGFGRTASFLVPVITGYLLKLGWTPAHFYFFFSGFLALGALCAALLDRTYFESSRTVTGTARRYEIRTDPESNTTH